MIGRVSSLASGVSCSLRGWTVEMEAFGSRTDDKEPIVLDSFLRVFICSFSNCLGWMRRRLVLLQCIHVNAASNSAPHANAPRFRL